MPRKTSNRGAISRQELESRLVELCLKSGMTGFPRGRRDQQLLLKSIVLTLDPTKRYTEREIDDRLLFWLADIARSVDMDHVRRLRRLVDGGHLERQRDGSAYWVSEAGPRDALFDVDVDGIDVYRVIGEGMKEIERKKRLHMAGNS